MFYLERDITFIWSSALPVANIARCTKKKCYVLSVNILEMKEFVEV